MYWYSEKHLMGDSQFINTPRGGLDVKKLLQQIVIYPRGIHLHSTVSSTRYPAFRQAIPTLELRNQSTRLRIELQY